MITLIAEKPSVGMELARLTGCRERHDGYVSGGVLRGEPCRVTWAFGHLCELGQVPEDAALHWKRENLPVIPSRFILVPRPGKDGKPDPGCVKQLAVIEGLFATTDTIVNCGDAGPEGELIQRRIYQYVGERNPRCRKPVLRLWISSTTDEAIRKGLASLQPGADYDNLYLAAKARSEADWLVGVNATEALTLSVNGSSQAADVYSLGRVQTPTLAMICQRYLEYRSFVPETFWTVRVHTESHGTAFTIFCDKRFSSYGEANSVRQRASIGLITVTSVETIRKTIPPPLLYDLAAAQQDASRLYNLNPDETQAIIQKLYEMKLVTYPRTGSRFIPKDVVKTIPGRIRNLAEHSNNSTVRGAALQVSQSAERYNMRSVNDTKVTDHYALLIETTPPPSSLSSQEALIYNLIATRMLEAFSPACETEVNSCTFRCADHDFKASDTRILSPGWKDVKKEEPKPQKEPTDPDQAPDQMLPPLREGDLLPVRSAEVKEGQTRPKPLYTMDTLIEAMKTAGKESDDDEIKAALKDTGIGTPATRAAIISNIMHVRRYIRQEKKKVVPTEKGLQVYQLVKDFAIANVEMTARWGIALSYVADGKMKADDFNGRIRTYARQLTAQILTLPPSTALREAALAENITCPLCSGLTKVWDTNARCTNPDCGLYTQRVVAKKKLTPHQMKQLLESGQTDYIQGFVSQNGKNFGARLKLIIEDRGNARYGNAQFVFEDRKPLLNRDIPKRSFKDTGTRRPTSEDDSPLQDEKPRYSNRPVTILGDGNGKRKKHS